MAFSVRKSGTDHSSIGFIDVESKELLPETLEDGFCRGLAFAPDSSGFYYSHRKVQDPRPHYQAVFWHSFGTALSKDQEVFFICLGPLLDMIRFHHFDFGAGWADEYGSPEDEEDFRSLYAYSPYHHVFNGQQYPALLIISGDSDTRCNPMHARKMTALLQSATGSGRPVLLDYRPGWGHMPVQPFSAKTEALTDRLAFICRELGIHVPTERIS
jgi:protease II